MALNNQRQSAKKFVEYWTFQRGSEKGEDQRFWNMLLRDVLGMEDVERRTKPQVPVQMKDTTKFLDLWIPETKVLIEHKSRGIKLDAPQPGHGGKTPYEQALEYNQARGFSEKARWIVTCNFDEIWVYDMDRPLSAPQNIRLGDLPKEVARLGFLVDTTVKSVREKEKDISIKAGRIVGELYKVLLKRYAVPDSPETLKALNRLCVRLVFLFYAEDADLFLKDAFWNFLKETPVKFLRGQLQKLFRVLDTPEAERDPYLEPELAIFPYTNGGLFKGVDEAEIPPMDDEIRELLIKSANFDWREISPTIFGALFESTLNPETRRAGGMVYTSVENIHKVIDPLFMNDLTRRVDEILGTTEYTEDTEKKASVYSVPSVVKKKLLALQEEMASLTFLDPACGSGNFLTETYLSLRRLENRIIAVLQKGQGELDLGLSAKVSLSQFHGIEINDFAVAVAKTALWISEAKMRHETAEILHREPDYLPLKDYDGIIEGNALRMDWGEVLTHGRREAESEEKHFDYIMGNPPFIGARNKSKEQAADMEAVFGADWKGLGNLDYVTAWYRKAVDECANVKMLPIAKANNQLETGNIGIGNTSTMATLTKVAFVSTNSICQGDGVAALWKLLFAQGLEIDFAWRTFRWDSEATEKAHVHCVIVGFHCGGQGTKGTEKTKGTSDKATVANVEAAASLKSLRPLSSLSSPTAKTIFDGGNAIPAAHINGYLMDAPDAWIESRSKPLCDVPPLVFGSMPNDGGFLSDWSDEARDKVIARYPSAAALFRPLLGSEEFINGKSRWCLWLKDASPAAIRAVPPVIEAVEKVREMRLASKREATRKLASTPTLFGEIRQPEEGHYLLVPKVSSEKREYVPMDFFTPETICSDLVFLVPSATLYHFGVLTSSVHMAWMRAVAGRLKSDYRYSANIVYNNFPWPDNAVEQGTKGTERTEGTRDKATAAECEILAAASLKSLRSLSSLSHAAAISQTAQAILDVRAKFPKESFANLYDEMLMPVELRKAHAANDRAVLAAYGLKPDTPEPEIVAHLFGLYAEMIKETKRTEETKGTKVTEATRETKEVSRSLRSLSSLRSLEGGSNG